jgi:hypothetical protein
MSSSVKVLIGPDPLEVVVGVLVVVGVVVDVDGPVEELVLDVLVVVEVVDVELVARAT